MITQAFRIMCAAGALIGSSAFVSGQYTFDIPTDGGVNNAGAAASGNVDFSQVLSTLTMTVTIQNDSTYSSSQLVGFWIRKPLSTLTPATPLDFDLTSGLSGWDEHYGETDNPFSAWNDGNDPDVDDSDFLFIGAQVQGNPDQGLAQGAPPPQGVFSFEAILDPGDSVDYSELGDREIPDIFVRWKSLVLNDNDPRNEDEDWSDSAKGYGFFTDEGEIPPIPEPREIAFLAMLGLGGMIFIRRRMQAKRK